MRAERRPDIDWLRVCAVYVLFFFHVGKVFDIPPYYHIKNAELSDGLGLFTGFVHQWHMPLFFVLAGWSVTASLEARGLRGFLGERVTRLLLPFVVGCVVLCPPIRYVEMLHGTPGFDEGFLTFLPRFFTVPGRFTWSHLWFLIYLFVFSCLYLPLFVLASRSARELRRLPSAALYLALVPLALVQVTLRARWPGYQNLVDDWANFLYYSAFFGMGFLLGRFPALEAAVREEWRRAALLGTVAMVTLVLSTEEGRVPATVHTLRWCMFWTASAATGLGFVVAFLGLGQRFLGFSNGLLRYASESAFPVYILHQAAIVLLGSWVIGLEAGVGAKYWLLLATSFAATMATYHLLVRPTPTLRFLLGMKAAPGRSPTVRGARTAAA